MKYKTLNELYKAYEFGELDRENNPMHLWIDWVIVENSLGDIVFEMLKDEIIREMAYWIHMPIK